MQGDYNISMNDILQVLPHGGLSTARGRSVRGGDTAEDRQKMEERVKARMKELDHHLRAGFLERSERPRQQQTLPGPI